MRTTTAGEDTILASTERANRLRVRAENGDGTLIDLTSLAGTDWVEAAEWGLNVDQPVPEATVRLRRDLHGLNDSLAPLATGSSVNVDDSGDYAPLVDAGRRITIEAATTAFGTSPSAPDWKFLFDGEIDVVRWNASPIEVVARDRIMAKLWDRWVEEETVYGTEDGVPIQDVMQAILDDWADGEPLVTSGTPGFRVLRYEQQKMSVLQALTTLVQFIGWDLKSRWDGSSAFELRFFEPNRSPVSTDHTFGQGEVLGVRRLDVDRAAIRNVVRVTYGPENNAQRAFEQVTSTTSVANFGRRYMEIEEASGSSIDTSSEAATLASSALKDLSTPQADQEVETLFFWPLELQDFLKFSAGDETFYSADQELGVYGFRHVLSNDGRERTFIQTRGKPAGQYLAWHSSSRTRRERDPEEKLNELRLLNFRRVLDTTNRQVTFKWDWGGRVEQAWIHDEVATQPEASDVFEGFASEEPDTIVDRDTDTAEYVASFPDSGDVRFLQFEPRAATMQPGPIIRVVVDPQSLQEPGGTVAARFDGTNLTAVANGNELVGSWKIAGAVNSAPAATTVRAQSAINGRSLTSTQIGTLATGLTDGDVGRVKAFAYTSTGGTGVESTAITDEAEFVSATSGFTTSIRGWGHDLDFSASDDDTVAWTSGTLFLDNGKTYSINSGNTGNLATGQIGYIVFDLNTATDLLLTKITASESVGSARILVAVAKANSDSTKKAEFQAFGGRGGVQSIVTADFIAADTITGNEIAANTIDTGELAAGSITTDKLDADAITTDKLDANAITTKHIIASESFAGTNVTMEGLVTFEADTNSTVAKMGVTGSQGSLTMFEAGVACGEIRAIDDTEEGILVDGSPAVMVVGDGIGDPSGGKLGFFRLSPDDCVEQQVITSTSTLQQLKDALGPTGYNLLATS